MVSLVILVPTRGLSIASGESCRCDAAQSLSSSIPGLKSEGCARLLGDRVQKTAVQSGIESHAQLTVIIVAQGNEQERLKTRALKLARRMQHFGHATDSAGSGVERDFDKVSGGKLMLQLQQSAGDGNGL